MPTKIEALGALYTAIDTALTTSSAVYPSLAGTNDEAAHFRAHCALKTMLSEIGAAYHAALLQREEDAYLATLS